MKSMVSVWLVCLAWLWTGIASAQTAAQDLSAQCPPFLDETAETLRWEVVSVPDMLYCRALRTDDGGEAFALTISSESPFKPRRGDRAEESISNGRKVQWYRGEVPNEPKVLIREALLELENDRVMHIFMRANDPEQLARRQQYVLSLSLPPLND